jgi:hypothetical protein
MSEINEFWNNPKWWYSRTIISNKWNLTDIGDF